MRDELETPRRSSSSWQPPPHLGRIGSGGSRESFASTITSYPRRKIMEDDDDGKWVITLDPRPSKAEGAPRKGNEDRRPSAPVRALIYFFGSPLCIVGLLLILSAQFTDQVGLLKLLPFLFLIKMAEVLLPWADFLANSHTALKFKSATLYLNRKMVECNEPPPDPDAEWRSVDLFVAKAFVAKTAGFAARHYNRRSNNVASNAHSSMGGMIKSFKPE